MTQTYYYCCLILIINIWQALRMSSGSGRRGRRGSGRTAYGLTADGGLTASGEAGAANARPSTLYEALLQLKVRLGSFISSHKLSQTELS